jgi:hypothetical protein
MLQCESAGACYLEIWRAKRRTRAPDRVALTEPCIYIFHQWCCYPYVYLLRISVFASVTAHPTFDFLATTGNSASRNLVSIFHSSPLLSVHITEALRVIQ